MSVKDGIELNEHDHPEYRESIQLYGDGKEAWLRAEIQQEVAGKWKGEPSIADCRYAAMRLHNKGNGYVVFDRLLCMIVDGVYYGDESLTNALGVAQWLNEGGHGSHAPCGGEALGLIYPSKKNLPEWDGTWKRGWSLEN